MAIPHPLLQVLVGWEGVMVRWGTELVVCMNICDIMINAEFVQK